MSLFYTTRIAACAISIVTAHIPVAHGAYWSVFNNEGESSVSAEFATYATLADMLADANRIAVSVPNTSGVGQNIIDSGSDGTTYWNLFNNEGESSVSAEFATYATLADMLADANRTAVSVPNTFGVGQNIVGTGSDGVTYWNVFNNEGESSVSAEIATYATLADMLADANRIAVSVPNTSGVGQNIIDSGSDGTTYWNLFNNEGESSVSADFATYATLADMLADANRVAVFGPNTSGVGQNIVGGGSDVRRTANPVPEPGALALFGLGLAGLAASRRRKLN